MTKIINLYGSPSTGKSTLASGLFYRMKVAGFNVDLASEWIKEKVYENAPYPFKDQLYTFAQQNKRLNQMINKADYVICDSPLLQICVYKSCEPEIFDQMALAYYNRYDNINILDKKVEFITKNNQKRLKSKLKSCLINITFPIWICKQMVL